MYILTVFSKYYPIFNQAIISSFIIYLPLYYYFQSLENKNSNISIPHCIPISLLHLMLATAMYGLISTITLADPCDDHNDIVP